MKKKFSILLAIMVVSSLLMGCASLPGKITMPDLGDLPDVIGGIVGTQGQTKETKETKPAGKPLPGDSENPVADSYSAYIEAKSVLLTRLTDGLSENPDTVFVAFSFFGIILADLSMLPVAFFGLGQEAVEMGLSIMGSKNVKYSEKGDSYSVTYSDEDGTPHTFEGTYDARADALFTSGSADGKETIYSEYRRTAYGYVAQYYMASDDGSFSAYQLAVDGEDGAIGIFTESGKLPPLTGKENPDFPISAPEWYRIVGNTITGVTAAGEPVNFVFP